MDQNEIINAKYAQIRKLLLESLEIEQNILDNANSYKRYAWLDQLVDKYYDIFKAQAELAALLDAPAPKKSFFTKLFRKN